MSNLTRKSNFVQRSTAPDSEKREKDDFYPTDPVAVDLLLKHEKFVGPVWECACGDGAISKRLEAHGITHVDTDLVDRGYGTPRVDFLMECMLLAPDIITNPPFKLALQFMQHAHQLKVRKLALFLPVRAIGGKKRGLFYKKSFLKTVYVLLDRPDMWRNGIKESENGGMIDFAWFVWDNEADSLNPTVKFI